MPKYPSPWQLLLWVIFQPQYLKQHAATLTRMQKAIEFLKVYFLAILPIALLTTIILLPFLIVITVLLDLPTYFPPDQIFLKTAYIEQFTQKWQQLSGFQEKLIFYFQTIFQKYTSIGIALQDFINGILVGISFGLISNHITGGLFNLLGIGLSMGLIIGLIFSLIGYLVIGLVLGLAYSLAGGLTGGLAMGISTSIAYAVIYGFAFGLTFAVAESLIFGILCGLIAGVIEGFTYHILYGLIFIPTFYIFYFRLIFYPFYTMSTHNHLESNPYLYDGLIWLPMWKIDNILLKQAYQQPELGIELARFLHTYRPLQARTAVYLAHAATVAHWKQQYPHINMLDLETNH
jgi:hypothetical protein